VAVQKREITLPDGRYLIFYSFPEENPPQKRTAERPKEETGKPEGSKK
jgi:hypothetical protein